VHQFGSTYKRLYKDAWSTKHKILLTEIYGVHVSYRLLLSQLNSD